MGIWTTNEVEGLAMNIEKLYLTIETEAQVVRENNISELSGTVELDNYEVYRFSLFIKEVVTKSKICDPHLNLNLVNWEQIAEEWL